MIKSRKPTPQESDKIIEQLTKQLKETAANLTPKEKKDLNIITKNLFRSGKGI